MEREDAGPSILPPSKVSFISSSFFSLEYCHRLLGMNNKFIIDISYLISWTQEDLIIELHVSSL